MTILENVLEDNKKFVENFEGEEMSHHAQKKLAILTCMDCRLIDFFEPALVLERGDAKIVRNAGNSIVGEDAIRSIIPDKDLKISPWAEQDFTRLSYLCFLPLSRQWV